MLPSTLHAVDLLKTCCSLHTAEAEAARPATTQVHLLCCFDSISRANHDILRLREFIHPRTNKTAQYVTLTKLGHLYAKSLPPVPADTTGPKPWAEAAAASDKAPVLLGDSPNPQTFPPLSEQEDPEPAGRVAERKCMPTYCTKLARYLSKFVPDGIM